MNQILAYEIDPATVNWILGGIAGLAAPVGLAIWAGFRKFIAFIKPHVEGFFQSHKTLVDTMSEQVPIVSDTLKKLGETQMRQCETLEQHSKLLEAHGGKLETLVAIQLKASENKPT